MTQSPPPPARHVSDAATTLRPLTWVGIGLLVVVADLRIGAVDLLADPAGWLVAGVALAKLAPDAPVLRVGVVACWCGAVASLLAVPAPEGPTLTLVVTVLQTVLVFATCTGVMVLRPSTSRTPQVIRWVDLAATALFVVLGVAAGETLLQIPVILVGAGVFVWFVVWLFLLGRRAAAPAVASTITA